MKSTLTCLTTGPSVGSRSARGLPMFWKQSSWNAPLQPLLVLTPQPSSSRFFFPRHFRLKYTVYAEPQTSECCDFPCLLKGFSTVMCHKPLEQARKVTIFTHLWFYMECHGENKNYTSQIRRKVEAPPFSSWSTAWKGRMGDGFWDFSQEAIPAIGPMMGWCFVQRYMHSNVEHAVFCKLLHTLFL